jgi:hypothetical protein
MSKSILGFAVSVLVAAVVLTSFMAPNATAQCEKVVNKPVVTVDVNPYTCKCKNYFLFIPIGSSGSVPCQSARHVYPAHKDCGAEVEYEDCIPGGTLNVLYKTYECKCELNAVGVEVGGVEVGVGTGVPKCKETSSTNNGNLQDHAAVACIKIQPTQE